MGVVGATGEREISRRMVSERASQRAFFGVSALLFAARGPYPSPIPTALLPDASTSGVGFSE